MIWFMAFFSISLLMAITLLLVLNQPVGKGFGERPNWPKSPLRPDLQVALGDPPIVHAGGAVHPDDF
jgi:hypothetical protein